MARAAFLTKCKANSKATLGTYKGDAGKGEDASESLHEKMCTPWEFKRLMRWRVGEWTSNIFDPSASLVSDRNVWEAMMKNEVTQFYKINVKVLEMVRKLSEFLQSILSVAEGGLSHIAGFNILSFIGPALMTLTIASIMVVMVKRA
ncbi:hypothetical protein GIB67_028415 [Kingdonia uniflora]|uniref:Uncharacterized protein n=1 Tax=Kingdonia uniflora TaxID=39325 RepID=A0A7J7MHZ2_9MAGN|nr:hypothetical protein GIB67_028415 [Kingdonia uniflora]